MCRIKKAFHYINKLLKGKKRYIFLVLMLFSVQFGYKYVIAEVFTDISQETVNYCEKKYDKEFTFVRYDEDKATPSQQVLILSDGDNEFSVTRWYDEKNNITYKENYVLYSYIDEIDKTVSSYIPEGSTFSVNIEDSNASCRESSIIGDGSVLSNKNTIICIDTVDSNSWSEDELNKFVEGVSKKFRFYINHRYTSESNIYRKDVIDAKGNMRTFTYPNN